jgi:AcrR family transcriptional regulator
VAAAIAVADTDGLAGLSMRAVAERLGVTAMALYTYVPGKDELVDLMYDGAHAELPARYDLGQGWRAAVTSWATHLVGFYVRHPWTLQVSFARPVLGPTSRPWSRPWPRSCARAACPRRWRAGWSACSSTWCGGRPRRWRSRGWPRRRAVPPSRPGGRAARRGYGRWRPTSPGASPTPPG